MFYCRQNTFTILAPILKTFQVCGKKDRVKRNDTFEKARL